MVVFGWRWLIGVCIGLRQICGVREGKVLKYVREAYLRSTLHEHPTADSIYAQHFVNSFRLVATQANLITRDNVPVLYAILGTY
jgi:hypothetical protein